MEPLGSLQSFTAGALSSARPELEWRLGGGCCLEFGAFRTVVGGWVLALGVGVEGLPLQLPSLQTEAETRASFFWAYKEVRFRV